MKDHPKFGKCPTTLSELEAWLLRDASQSSGGAQATAETYLEIICGMTGGNSWKEYAAKEGISE